MKLDNSPLCISLGVTPTMQLLSFLIAHRDFDYSKTELAKNTELSRQTIYRALEPLLRFNMVEKSRKIGNTTLYKLQTDSKPIIAIQHFNETIINMIVYEERDKNIEKEEDITNVKELLKIRRK